MGGCTSRRCRYDPARHAALLGYQGLLAARDGGAACQVAVLVGAQEEPQRSATGSRSLRDDAESLHRALGAAPGVTSRLTVLPGGHDEALWPVALSAGLQQVRHRGSQG